MIVMKTLMKWNFLVILFMMCSVPLLVGCGDDDDDDGNPTGEYIGWKDAGNKATFGYEAGYGNYKGKVIFTLTFDGSGEDAKCTKCEAEETWSTEELAIESYNDHKDQDGVSNLKRSGKKVTYEIQDFIGQTRKWLKKIIPETFKSL
jgi:major membrane immunogen (membrane-anchored lipoprotein)